MHRNLDRRVECLVALPGRDPLDQVGRMLDLAFDDATSSWWLEPTGTWVRHHLDESGEPLRDLQDTLITTRRRRRTSTASVTPAPPR